MTLNHAEQLIVTSKQNITNKKIQINSDLTLNELQTKVQDIINVRTQIELNLIDKM
jgi:hypothetical protein